MPTGDAWHTSDEPKEGFPWALFDPDAVIDVPHDISGWMTKLGSAYASHVMVADPNLSVSSSYSAPNIVARVSRAPSGVLASGERYSVTFRVTTANGQVDDRTLWFKVQEL